MGDKLKVAITKFLSMPLLYQLKFFSDSDSHGLAGFVLRLRYSTGLTAVILENARVEETGMLYAEALENF